MKPVPPVQGHSDRTRRRSNTVGGSLRRIAPPARPDDQFFPVAARVGSLSSNEPAPSKPGLPPDALPAMGPTGSNRMGAGIKQELEQVALMANEIREHIAAGGRRGALGIKAEIRLHRDPAATRQGSPQALDRTPVAPVEGHHDRRRGRRRDIAQGDPAVHIQRQRLLDQYGRTPGRREEHQLHVGVGRSRQHHRLRHGRLE